MKQAENNEIDTLLRNLARHQRATDYEPDSASREFAAQGAHLDVDELSSYAERALPPSARARCTAHLADCDDCRKIVAQLSLATGPLTDERKPQLDAVVGLTWSQRLAALFSPRMIRYAFPALVVVLAAAGFFGWYQQRAERFSDQVALNKRAEPASAVRNSVAPQAAPGTEHAAGKSNNGDIAAERDEREARAQPTATVAAPAKVAKEEGASSDEKKTAGAAGGSVVASKAAKPDDSAADKTADRAAGEQPAYATEPPAPAPKPQSVAVNQEQQKDLAKNTNMDGLDRGANVRRQGPARNDNDVSQRGPAKTQSQSVAKLKGSETASGGRARSEDDEAETKAVAGRHFRRVDSGWVDTAYKSSMPIRNVTRDTEEYRALIADEPVIGNIGKQLGGEVIVVWKSHAYRIN